VNCSSLSASVENPLGNENQVVHFYNNLYFDIKRKMECLKQVRPIYMDHVLTKNGSNGRVNSIHVMEKAVAVSYSNRKYLQLKLSMCVLL